MATFAPLDAARYLGLEGGMVWWGFFATSHFPGIRHLKKAQKNLKPPAALRVKQGGGSPDPTLFFKKGGVLPPCLTNGRTFYRALALGLSSELPTLCGQLARRSTAKLCHNQLHMTCGSHPLLI